MKNEGYRGRCLCGGVTFVAFGEPSWVGICHCSSCRRATGGILMAAAGFSRSEVQVDGASLVAFASSPGVRRSFCNRCGTSICYESDQWPEDIHLMVGAFDEAHQMNPNFHIFAEDRLSWLRLCDGLPHYRTTPSNGKRMD